MSRLYLIYYVHDYRSGLVCSKRALSQSRDLYEYIKQNLVNKRSLLVKTSTRYLRDNAFVLRCTVDGQTIWASTRKPLLEVSDRASFKPVYLAAKTGLKI